MDVVTHLKRNIDEAFQDLPFSISVDVLIWLLAGIAILGIIVAAVRMALAHRAGEYTGVARLSDVLAAGPSRRPTDSVASWLATLTWVVACLCIIVLVSVGA